MTPTTLQQSPALLLQQSPALAGFQPPGNQRKEILEQLEERAYEVSVDGDEGLDNPTGALRFILSGTTRVVRGPAPGKTVRLLGPGSLSGLWGMARRRSWSLPRPALVERLAHPTGSTVRLIEIPHGAVPGLLWEWLKKVYAAQLEAEELLAALHREPRFATLPEPEAFRLLESAYAVEQCQLRIDAVPQDFYVLLKGSCKLKKGSKQLAQLEAPACIGHKQLLLQQPMAGEPVVDLDGRLFCVDGGYLNRLRAQSPELRRALLRGSPELSRPRLSLEHGRQQFIVVEGDTTLAAEHEPALGRMLWLLAERIAAHLHDHVLLLHFHPGDEGSKPLGSWTPRKDSDCRGWVSQWSVPFGSRGDWPRKELELVVARASWQGQLQGRVNVVLIDTSGLEPGKRSRLLTGLARSTRLGEVKLVQVSKDPSKLGAREGLPGNVKLVPTGVLSEPGPRPWQRKRLDRVRRVVEGERGALPWPLGTVRVLLPNHSELPQTLESSQQPLRESFERWARAVTGRRVGLALGGGGAYGAAHVGLIERLHAEQVPIDLVSGSSMGAAVGTYLSVTGPEGLRERMARDIPWLMRVSLPLAPVSSVVVKWVMDYLLGAERLEQLALPMFPVATDADMGVEWDVREGTVGLGIRASGSLPPLFGPTHIRNRRLLDGGLVANVPVNVLRTEGADMIIASNPIRRVDPRTRKSAETLLDKALLGLEVRKRLEDSLRMLVMMGRVAGESQTDEPGLLVYRPKYNHAWLMGTSKFAQIAREAAESPELNMVVLEARKRWRMLLNNPPALLRWHGDEAVLSLPVQFEEDELTPGGRRILDELVEELQGPGGWRDTAKGREYLRAFTLRVKSGADKRGVKRARAVEQYVAPFVPQKVTVEGGELKKGETLEIKLTQVGWSAAPPASLARLPELRLLHLQRKEEARWAAKEARIKGLLRRGEKECREGDMRVAGQLALEAAELEASPEVDRLMREVLQRKGLELHRYENGASATCFAWSPDERYLAVGGKDGALRVWAAGGQSPCKMDSGGEDPNVNAVAWSPGGDLLASSDNAWQVNVWSVTPPLEVGGMPRVERKGGIHATWNQWGLAFSPDGQLLLGPWEDHRPGEGIRVRQAAVFPVKELCSGSPVRWVLEREVTAAAWAPGQASRTVATAGGDEVCLWRVETGGVSAHVSFAFDGACTLSWAPDGRTLAVGGTKGVLLLTFTPEGAWDAREVLELEPISQVAWSHGASWLVAAARTGLVYTWQWPARHRTMLRVDQEGAQNLRCHPRREEYLLVWRDNRASVWDLRNGRRLSLLTGHHGQINQACWHADGAQVTTASADEELRVWNPECEAPPAREQDPVEWRGRGWYTGKQPFAVESPRTREDGKTVWRFSSPDGSRRIVPMRSPGGELWVAEEPDARVEEGSTPAEGVSCLWNPKGTRAVLREKSRVALWDGKSPRGLTPGPLEEGDILSLAWHPEGQYVAYGQQNELMFLDAKGEPPSKVPSYSRNSLVWDVAWNPAGELLATACNNSYAYVFVWNDGRATQDVTMVQALHHPFPVERLAWSPAGQLLATGDRSGVVRIWTSDGQDLASSAQVRRTRIRHLVWSRNGSRLLSVDEEGQALVWKFSLGQWVLASELLQDAFTPRWAAFNTSGTVVAIMGTDGKLRQHTVSFSGLRKDVERRISPSRSVTG